MPDVQCIRVMRQRGMGIREIARSLHLSRKTVRKYTAADYVVEAQPRPRQRVQSGLNFFGGVSAQILFDYVARHIVELLCPAGLCAGGLHASGMALRAKGNIDSGPVVRRGESGEALR